MRVSLAIVLLGLGLLRAVLLIGDDTMPTYLDQGDGKRLGLCVGLSPAQRFFDQTSGTNPVSSRTLLLTEPSHQDCEPSSAAVIPWIVKSAAQWFPSDESVKRAIDARAISFAYLFCFFALALAIHRSLSGEPRWQRVAAFLFALLICDPANTLYFGALFTESIALLGCYGVVAAICLARAQRVTPAAIVFLVSCFVVAFSRSAHFVLPILLALPMIYLLRTRARGLAALLFASAVILSATSWQAIGSQDKHALVNRANAITHAAAPLADNPKALIHKLGLPEACGKLVGVSWYVTYGHDVKKTCPALATIGAREWLLTLATEPVVAAHLAYKSLLFVGNAKQVHLLGDPSSSNQAKQWSIFDALPYLDFRARLAIVFLAASLFFLSLLNTHKHLSNMLASVSLAIAATVAIISLLGDGFSELSRHAHLAYSLTVTAITIWIARSGIRAMGYLLLAAALSVVSATYIAHIYPVTHVSPMQRNGENGLLVVTSQSIERVNVSLAGASISSMPTLGLDQSFSRILGVRGDTLVWVPVPILPPQDECRPLIVDFEFGSGKTRRESVCVLAL
jgi:ABC-type methionine transport system permease subunit